MPVPVTGSAKCLQLREAQEGGTRRYQAVCGFCTRDFNQQVVPASSQDTDPFGAVPVPALKETAAVEFMPDEGGCGNSEFSFPDTESIQGQFLKTNCYFRLGGETDASVFICFCDGLAGPVCLMIMPFMIFMTPMLRIFIMAGMTVLFIMFLMFFMSFMHCFIFPVTAAFMFFLVMVMTAGKKRNERDN